MNKYHSSKTLLIVEIEQLQRELDEAKNKIEILEESRKYWKNIANSRFEHHTTIAIQRSESGLF